MWRLAGLEDLLWISGGGEVFRDGLAELGAGLGSFVGTGFCIVYGVLSECS